MQQIIISALFLMLTLPAFALNKCVEPSGKVIYTDAPCAGTAKKVDLQIRTEMATPPVSTTDSALNTDTDKLKTLRNSRREKEIKSEIEQLEDEISVNQVRMDRDLGQLRNKKSHANNNFAGATWEQSISTEMQAVTATYTTKINMAQNRIRNLSEELSALRNKK